MRRSVLGIGVLLLGCGSETRWFEPPADAGSLLLGIERDDQVSVFAYELGPGKVIAPDVSVPLDGSTRVRGLLYDEPLADLGWSVGELAGHSETEEPRPVHLPDPSRILDLDLSASGSAAWQESSGLSPALEHFRVRPLRPCPRFEAHSHLIGDVGNLRYFVHSDESHVLLGASDGSWLVDAAGNMEPITVQPDPDARLTAAFRAQGGGLWFASRDRRVWRGTLSPGRLDLALVSTASSSAGEPRYLAGGGSVGEELYMLDDLGRLHHYDGALWSQVYAFDHVDGDSKGGLEWLGPGRVVAAHQGSAEVLYLDGGEQRTIAVGTRVQVPALRDVPGLGMVAGSSSGDLFLEADGRFELLAEDRQMLNVPVYSIEPYEDGLVYGGAVALFGSYFPEVGACRDEPFGITNAVNLAVLGRDVLIGTEEDRARHTLSFVVMKRIDAP